MSSTFFAVRLAGGSPDFNGPVCEPSPPARSTAGADLFSQPTIPAAVCTQTCANSAPSACVVTSASSPTSLSAPLLARKSAPPTARERALQTITCSGTGRVSSSKSDLFGVRLRTALAHELGALTGYSMRWRQRTTPSGHAWWVLTMPEPITSESECGSLLPTPSASSYGSNRGGAAGRTGDVRPSLASMMTATQGPRHGDRPQKEGRILVDILPAMLNTPRASRGYDSKEFSGGAAINPRKLVYKMIPTPTARDIRSDRASEQTMARNSRPLSETSGALGLTGTVESPVSQRRALLLGLVLWMMGQAPSWLQACATAPLPRSVTRFSPKSRKRSGEQS